MVHVKAAYKETHIAKLTQKSILACLNRHCFMYCLNWHIVNLCKSVCTKRQIGNILINKEHVKSTHREVLKIVQKLTQRSAKAQRKNQIQ